MKQLLIKSTVAIAVLALLAPVSSAVSLTYDAGPEGGGPADIDPVLQGWDENEVDNSSGPPLQNVFFDKPDFGSGFNATRIDDQQGTPNPSPNDNPRYEIFLSNGNFADMYAHGWEMNFRFKPIQGGNFVAWGINPDTATDPGWGLGTTRERVGFGLGIDAGNNSATISPIGGTLINLGADTSEDYHLITAVGDAGSSSVDLFVDGAFNQTYDIKDGTSNSGSDDRLFWESGSSGGVGRSVAWNLVSLEFVPEPSSFFLAGIGMIGLVTRRRRS
jgi:hypothetical protein